MSKKTDEEFVYCVECKPHLRFEAPMAAERLREHYEAGKHLARPKP